MIVIVEVQVVLAIIELHQLDVLVIVEMRPVGVVIVGHRYLAVKLYMMIHVNVLIGLHHVNVWSELKLALVSVERVSLCVNAMDDLLRVIARAEVVVHHVTVIAGIQHVDVNQELEHPHVIVMEDAVVRR